jgi:hypothetical protein
MNSRKFLISLAFGKWRQEKEKSFIIEIRIRVFGVFSFIPPEAPPSGGSSRTG